MPYVDIPNELAAIAEAIPDYHKTAVNDLIADRDQYSIVNGVLTHTASGKPAREYVVTDGREKYPHRFFSKDPLVLDLEAAAFSGDSPNRLKARGRMVQDIGETLTVARARAWGLKGIADMSPGVRPGTDTNGNGADKDKSSKNPWVTGDRAKMVEIISSLGTRVAAGLAKAAGKDISGAPLRR